MNSLQASQAYLFLLFVLNGIIIGIVFDSFRVLRRSFKTSDFVTLLEDILFWILTGIITLFFLFRFNQGEIRFYIFVGIFLGIILYMISISKYFIKINVIMITTIKKVVIEIVKIVLYPIKVIFSFFKKLFFKPVSFVFINIRRIFRRRKEKIVNKIKKIQNPIKKEDLKKDF